jgi:hypothetical protein
MQFVVVRSLMCLMALLGGVTVSRAANAEATKKVQIVAIMSDDAYEQAQALTTALKSAVEKDGRWALQSGDYSLEVMVTALNCTTPPDATCLGKVASKIGADRFVWGSMRKEGGNVVAKLRFWDQGSLAAETTLKYSSNLNDAAEDNLVEVARGALKELVGAPSGTLVVQAGKANGEVWVAGRRAAKIRNGQVRLALPEGEHEVELRASGYDPVSSTVTIASGEQTELTLEPTPRSADSAASAPADSPSAPSSTQRTLGWVAIGVGGAFAAGGVYSMLRVASISEDPAFETYRNRMRADQDACDEADRGTRVPGAASPTDIADKCSTAQTFEALQYVFFGLAAASAGTGAVLLLTDSGKPKREQQTIRLRPSFRPSAGSTRVDLTVVF